MRSIAAAAAAPRHCRFAEIFEGGIAGLVFDCDGVLFDSRDANAAYYNHILARLGLPPLKKEEEAFAHMVSTTEVLQRMVPEHRWAEAEEIRKATTYSASFMDAMKPVPLVREFLQAAKSAGLRLGMCTNRSDAVAAVLEHYRLEGFFDPVMTISRAAPKPAPQGLLAVIEAWNAPRCAVGYIGDSLVDQQAADAAGIPFLSFRNNDLRARLHIKGFDELFTLLEPCGE